MNNQISLILAFFTGLLFVFGQNTASIDDLCTPNKKYKIDLRASSKFVEITPKDFNSDGEPYYTHHVDLNNDGKKDLIVNLKDCTDPTHCKFGIYIQCDNGEYVSVYSPEYWLPSFRISKNTDGWKEIVLYERNIELGRISVKDTLKFNDLNYTIN